MGPTITDAETTVGVRVMPPPVPRRKLTIPPPPRRLLGRPELEDRVREGLRAKVLLVVGPAGQGKTTSVAEAVRGEPAVTWLSLDRADAAAGRMAALLIASLVELAGTDLDEAASAPLEDQLGAVCRDLDELPHHAFLVLDDGTGSIRGRAARFIDLALDWLPSHVHVAILTRAITITTERRRACGELVEIGPDDLCFDRSEIRAYLTDTCGLRLDENVIDQVSATTEGWPLGLELVAARLTATSDAGGLAGNVAAGRSGIASSLVQEILEGLDESDRRFALDIAVLDPLTADACERLTEQASAAERLARLAAVGLLLPVDAFVGSYRHRPLLRPALVQQLRLDDPRREPALRTVAASLAARQGAWTDAVDHALSAGDDAQAVDWLEAHLDELIGIGGGVWFAGVTSRLPPAVVASHARLLAGEIDLAALSADRDSLERILMRLERSEGDGHGGIEMRRRVRSFLSRLRGDGVEALLANRSTRTIDPLVAHPLGIALAAEGRHDAAGVALRVALEAARGSREPVRELLVMADLAWERAAAGYLVDADRLARRSTDLAGTLGFSQPPAAAVLAEAQIALDRGRVEVAREQAARARAVTSCGCDLVSRTEVGLFVSRARLLHSDARGAVQALDELEREMREHTPGGGLASRLVRAHASMRLALDDVAAALALLPGIRGQVDALPPEDRLIAAHVDLRLGDAQRARRTIDTLRDTGLGPRLTIHALRIDAAALAVLGDDPGAARVRRQAERIARAGGLAIPATHRRPTASDVGAAAGARPHEVASGTSLPAEALTERELAVLQLLPSATNVEIANGLYVSVNTVKTHLKSIYRKLGVASRQAAVHQGQALGLI